MPDAGVERSHAVELAGGLAYEVRLDATPDAAWRLWTDPEQLVRWMGSRATLEPRPGGVFRLEYSSGDVAAGAYVEVDPERRVAFTWGWEAEPTFGPGTSTIEVAFEKVAAGGTLLRLLHSGMPSDLRGNVDEGWRYFLGRLVEAAAGT